MMISLHAGPALTLFTLAPIKAGDSLGLTLRPLFVPTAARGLPRTGAEPRSKGKIPPDAGEDAGVTMGVTRRVTLADAAQVLGISKEAVRKRVKRGTLRSEKDPDGRVYVYVPFVTDAGEDASRPSVPPSFAERDELVEELRDRVRALEEANRETRRLLAGALERIPAIEPPETPGASETATGEPERVETPPQATAPQAATERRASWWRRFFGFE